MFLALRMLMIAVFAMVGLFPNLSFSTSENVAKIEITHRHEDGVHHHHHGLSSEGEHHSDQDSTDNDSQESPKERSCSDQHSHEIVVSGGQVFTTVNKVTLPEVQDFERIFPNSFEELPPRSRYLSSIFRPPISS